MAMAQRDAVHGWESGMTSIRGWRLGSLTAADSKRDRGVASEPGAGSAEGFGVESRPFSSPKKTWVSFRGGVRLRRRRPRLRRSAAGAPEAQAPQPIIVS
ncbi:Hypothetical protein A7982_07650 [Minicystis rosea]|nr:Hypothetical protein A7982_07650 [Minicystis rosea]